MKIRIKLTSLNFEHETKSGKTIENTGHVIGGR